MVSTYIPLRLHSLYSVGEGMIRLKGGELAQACADLGIPACAITDTSTLAGIATFSESLSKAGIQAIIGTQVMLRDETGMIGVIALYAATKAGLARLTALSSQAAIDGEMGAPCLTINDLVETDGLIALSGGIHGPIDQALLANHPDVAHQRAQALQVAFQGRFLLEISRMGTPDEMRREPGLLALSAESGIALVATNEAYFLTPDEHAAHDALLCVSGQTYLSVADRRRVPATAWLRSPADMDALFADLPEALANTVRVAKSCGAVFETQKPKLPSFPGLPDGMTEDAHLRAVALSGLQARMDRAQITDPAYTAQLEFELDVITRMGFAGYFLIVADFIGWAKDQGIPVGPGRGSGAGSVVAWALRITDLDPIHHGLLFERFLNPDRVSMPDFDIDFAQNGRDRVIAYVRSRYDRVDPATGLVEPHVAQISTYQALMARAAVKAVGRVMGLNFNAVHNWVQLIPANPANPVTLTQAMEGDVLAPLLARAEPSVRLMFKLALGIEGLYSNLSTHAAGVVISRDPIAKATPLVRELKNGELITQFNMKVVEQDGQVKFDFLGLKTLDMIEGTCAIMHNKGVTIDLDTVGMNDAQTYALIAEGKTFSVFQFESSGMREAIRQVKPDRFEDLVALGALYRPGPMANIPEYGRIKNGQDTARYAHALLEPVLADTHGIMIYQEQVMQIARDMAGYSLGQADLLRRAMGKKIRYEMDQQQDMFTEGCVARGIDRAKAVEVFDLMAKFADYGFNKSHAAAYAVLSFQTAYLKAHYPEAFFASAMNLELNKVEQIAMFMYEARRAGIVVLPPDVNRSQARFDLDTYRNRPAVRFGLAAIRDVGEDVTVRLVEDRVAHGAFLDLEDFVRRASGVGFNRRTIERLIQAGALDSINRNRGALLAGLAEALVNAESTRRVVASGQGLLFDFGGLAPKPVVADLDPMERMAGELTGLGFYFSNHPLKAMFEDRTAHRHPMVQSLSDVMSLSVEELGSLPRNGMLLPVVVMKKPEFKKTRSGKSMAILTVSDPRRMMEVLLFDEKAADARALMVKGERVFLQARVQDDGDGGERRLWVDGLLAMDPNGNPVRGTKAAELGIA